MLCNVSLVTLYRSIHEACCFNAWLSGARQAKMLKPKFRLPANEGLRCDAHADRALSLRSHLSSPIALLICQLQSPFELTCVCSITDLIASSISGCSAN